MPGVTTTSPRARASHRCWCGAKEVRPHGRVEHAALLQCVQCGCFRIDPPPLAAPAESAGFYSDYYARRPDLPGPANGAGGRSRFWRVVEAVPSLQRVGRQVGDVGCGDGELCGELQARGWPVVMGFDVSATRIARARSRHPDVAFHACSFAESGVPPRSFDLLVLDNVLEHLPDPRRVLDELRGFLRPDGRLVIVTPNMASGHFRFLKCRWTPELAPHVHLFLFTPDALEAALKAAGLRTLALGSFHLPFYSWRAWVHRVASGDMRGALWRAHQELGTAYGHLIGAGPMLYAVAGPDDRSVCRTPRTLH